MKARDLFEATAKELLARLKGGECEHCGRTAASASELNIVRQFLRDNKVEFLPEEKTDDPIANLIDSMPEFTPPEYA
jgi:methionyl-tRNA synthetase